MIPAAACVIDFPIAFQYESDILVFNERQTGCLAGDFGFDGFENVGTNRLSLHGYIHGRIARRIEQTSANLLTVNYGTLYPAMLKLEQERYIASRWSVSDNNRKARFYELTRAGRKQIGKETEEWERMTEIVARFLSPKEGLA